MPRAPRPTIAGVQEARQAGYISGPIVQREEIKAVIATPVTPAVHKPTLMGVPLAPDNTPSSAVASAKPVLRPTPDVPDGVTLYVPQRETEGGLHREHAKQIYAVLVSGGVPDLLASWMSNGCVTPENKRAELIVLLENGHFDADTIAHFSVTGVIERIPTIVPVIHPNVDNTHDGSSVAVPVQVVPQTSIYVDGQPVEGPIELPLHSRRTLIAAILAGLVVIGGGIYAVAHHNTSVAVAPSHR